MQRFPFFICLFWSTIVFFTPVYGEKLTKKEKQTRLFETIFFDATQAKLNDNKEKAIALYKKCIQINSKEPSPYYEVSKLYNQSDNHIKALPFIEKGYKLNPENAWIGLEYAKSLFANKAFEKSLKIYHKLIEKDARNPELYFSVFNLYIILKDYKKAIENIERLELVIGVNEKTTKEKQRLYLKLNDIDGALNTVRKLIKKYPKNDNYKLMLAKIHFANEQEEKGVEVYKDILKSDSTNIGALLFLYEYYLQKEDINHRKDILKGIVYLEDVKLETKLSAILSEFLIYKKDTTADYRHIMELTQYLIDKYPKSSDPYIFMGDYYMSLKNKLKASSYYKKALDINADNLPLWNQLVFIQLEISDTNNIINYSKKALELFPSQSIFYYFKSIGFQMQKKYREAITSIEIGIDFAENKNIENSMKTVMADCLYQIGKKANAFEIFDQLLKENEDNVYVLNNYSYYLSLEDSALNKAEKMSKKSIELAPDEYNYYDTYAWILFKKKQYEDALNWIKKSIEKGGDASAVIIEHKGDILYHLGKKEKALEFWKQSLKNQKSPNKLLKRKIKDGTFYEE